MFECRDQGVEGVQALYGPLPRWYHEATYLNCYETDFGLEMIGKGTMWVDLPGGPVAGEEKTDGKGKQWDVVGKAPLCFNMYQVMGRASH